VIRGIYVTKTPMNDLQLPTNNLNLWVFEQYDDISYSKYSSNDM